jgi:hypothetical protein
VGGGGWGSGAGKNAAKHSSFFLSCGVSRHQHVQPECGGKHRSASVCPGGAGQVVDPVLDSPSLGELCRAWYAPSPSRCCSGGKRSEAGWGMSGEWLLLVCWRSGRVGAPPSCGVYPAPVKLVDPLFPPPPGALASLAVEGNEVFGLGCGLLHIADALAAFERADPTLHGFTVSTSYQSMWTLTVCWGRFPVPEGESRWRGACVRQHPVAVWASDCRCGWRKHQRSGHLLAGCREERDRDSSLGQCEPPVCAARSRNGCGSQH